MRYVLVKYQRLKLLVEDHEDISSLLPLLADIVDLESRVGAFFRDILNADHATGAALDQEAVELMEQIGYAIGGVPFTRYDAELYALDRKLDYDVLELHGNTGNSHAKKTDEREYEQINIRVEKPLKTLAVRHVCNSEHKNLTQYLSLIHI